jgi:hypothetical protein
MLARVLIVALLLKDATHAVVTILVIEYGLSVTKVVMVNEARPSPERWFALWVAD